MVEGGFPESAWQSRLFAEYRDLVGPTTEAPDAFLWGALAGALSFLIGQDARYPWGAGFQPPTLLIALIGTTGKARKSTCHRRRAARRRRAAARPRRRAHRRAGSYGRRRGVGVR